jgi:phosphatidylserine decarboxylase
MAIVHPQIPPLPSSVTSECIQPGGGFCLSLELAWGRCRRAWLRRFRPGYVRRLQQERQGLCPNCSHDIIDARDLKFYRNACGYWFREEDDRFRWRGRLGLARAGLAEVVCFSLLFLILSTLAVVAATLVGWGFWLVLAALLFFWFETVYFFRDPHRVIPGDPHLLLSPADGRVTHMHEVDEPDFPGGRALRISIFLSVFSVHVNRIPRTGRIVNLRYFPGAFLDARRPDCPARNEQFWIDVEEPGSGRLVRVKQISGAVARRIVCWLKIGESVRAGDRLGMIKFGSRTDVFVPVDDAAEILVEVGSPVHGGATALLRYRSPANEIGQA